MKAITEFWDWIDGRGVIRRIVLFVTLWLTWESYRWAAMFAESTDKSGVEVAAIIAAVTAPVTLLQASAFKAYIEGRTG